MAISEKRLSMDTIASLTKVDFDTAEDIVEKKPASSAPTSKSVLDKSDPVEDNPKLASQGIHPAEGNDRYTAGANVPASVKNTKATTSNNRNLATSKGKTTVDALNDPVNGNASDNYLKTNKPINPKRNILSSAKEAKIDSMIKLELGGISKGLYGASITEITGNVKSKLVSAINNTSGTTLKNKLNIDSVINDCFRDGIGNFNIGDLDFLSMIINAAFLDMISCAGIEKAVDMLTGFLGFTPENRGMLLKGLKTSMSVGNDKNTANKLLLTKKVMDSAATDQERNLLAIHTRGITDTVLNSLGKSDYKTKSTTSDYNDITGGLDALDPSWKTDDNNNTNYHKTSKNPKMKSLADNANKNRYTMPATFNGSVDTVIPVSLGITMS